MVQDEVRGRHALPVVAVGVLAVSAAAIFIRLADAPALAVAFWGCALGAALLLPPAMVRRERLPRGTTLYVGLASGVALGAHFGFWISSLDYTSVAASVVLVSTQPVFVAILAYLVFGERTSPLSFAGILAALEGTAVSTLPFQGGSLAGSAALLRGARQSFCGEVVSQHAGWVRAERQKADKPPSRWRADKLIHKPAV